MEKQPDEIFCPECGKINKKDACFCRNCSNPLKTKTDLFEEVKELKDIVKKESDKKEEDEKFKNKVNVWVVLIGIILFIIFVIWAFNHLGGLVEIIKWFWK